MFLSIAHNVRDRIANFAWGTERMRMVPASNHGALSAQNSVDALGNTHAQPLHRAAQFPFVLCLDDKVKVGRLNRKVHDTPKSRAGAAYLGHHGAREHLASHAGEPPLETDSNMHGDAR